MAQRLAQHLISRGLLPAKVVDDAMRKLSGGSGVGLDTILLEAQAVSEAGMLQALSDVSGMRLVNLADFEPNAEAGPMLPLKISRRLTVVPLSVDGNILHLAVGYPVPHKELREVAFLLGKELELWIALECRIKDWQAALYREPMTDRYKALLRDLDPGRRGLTPAPVAPPKPSSKPAAPAAKAPTQYPKVSAPPPPPPLPKSRLPDLSEEQTLDVSVESISVDMLEKIAKGVVAEPVLLTKPKKKQPSAQPPPPPPEFHSTVVLEPKAYAAAFVKPSLATDEQMETAVLDTTGYANFAKVVSNSDAPKKRTPGDRTPTEPEMPAIVLQPPAVAPVKAPSGGSLPRITAQKTDDAARAPDKFPGGVLPPRSRLPEQAPTPTNKEVRAVDRNWVMPAPSARPSIERLKSSAGGPNAPPPPSAPRPAPKPIPVPPLEKARPAAKPATASALRSIDTTLPNLPAPVLDETDFGDLNAPPSGKMPVLTPAPVQKAGAALPPEPPRPSVPEPQKPQPPKPPELKPSQGAAPVIADEAPAAPPELAAAAVENFPPPAPSAPLGPRMVTGPAALVVPSGNPAEWTLAQARAALRGSVQDRDKLVSVALDYGRRAFEFVGAFAVVRGAATGWAARSEGEVPEIRHVSIPLDAASVFRTVALTRGSYVGPLPPDALTQHYLALLGRSPRAVFLWPVEVKGRLVAMLYGDNSQKPVSQRKLNDFILFCQELPSAFGELIVFRKQRLGTSAAFTTADGVEHAINAPIPAEGPDEPDFAQADAEWFTGLLTLLTGPDPRERANAMTELSRTPESSARALVRAFPGPTAWSRLPVTELPEVDELGPIPGSLARLGRPASVALAPLLDADDSDVRYLALLTAGALPYPELLDGVLRGLFDMEPDISSAARAAATAMKDVDGYETAVKALRQELASRDPLRKSLAARALGMLHDREAIEGLIGLTASEDQLCAQSAAEALRETCRANLGPNARQWAAWYAMARGRRRVEWLTDALESEEFELRLAAIEELSRAFGDNLGYFADGPELERAAAVDQWRAQIQTHPDFEV